ncbi:MAG: hypothetical protein HND56_04565 [Pseudomonadota bacterium]|nr:hypothetical protein [Pseudomonadota bacterium]QKK05007.1 MAG: hypothetical protein HND56_04565 [Pseudomonadota bacterium]
MGDSDSDKTKKFLFDLRSFDVPDPEHVEPPKFSEEEVAQFKQESFESGKSSGMDEARRQQEETLIALMRNMSALLTKLLESEARREEEKNNAIIRLSLKIAQKLFPGLAKAHAMDEIERTVQAVLEKRKEEPRLVVTVHDSILDKLRERMDTLSETAGFHGKIILMGGDDHLAPTDCRIEWADGGAEKNFEQIFTEIENTLSKQLAGQRISEKPAAKENVPEPE